MKAIVLCGVSGVGKTYLRTHDESLKNLPVVDIADIYREAREKYPEYPLDWQTATEQVLQRIKLAFNVMKEHSCWSPPYTVAVEGYFLPGTPSRKMLEDGLRILGIKAEFRLMWAPYEVCVERLSKQHLQEKTPTAEYQKRLELLNKCWRPKGE